jgi:hypothetical protein
MTADDSPNTHDNTISIPRVLPDVLLEFTREVGQNAQFYFSL